MVARDRDDAFARRNRLVVAARILVVASAHAPTATDVPRRLGHHLG